MDVEQLITSISKLNPRDIQEEAIKKLVNIVDIDLRKLVRPKGKEHWENAAEVIKLIGFPRIEEVVPQLFEWIADLTWPGAETILDVLATIDKPVLVSYIEKVAKSDSVRRDRELLFSIKLLIYQAKIKSDDFKNVDLFELINAITEV